MGTISAARALFWRSVDKTLASIQSN